MKAKLLSAKLDQKVKKRVNTKLKADSIAVKLKIIEEFSWNNIFSWLFILKSFHIAGCSVQGVIWINYKSVFEYTKPILF